MDALSLDKATQIRMLIRNGFSEERAKAVVIVSDMIKSAYDDNAIIAEGSRYASYFRAFYIHTKILPRTAKRKMRPMIINLFLELIQKQSRVKLTDEQRQSLSEDFMDSLTS